MISPYDDQLIGKMNFRFSGIEHSMFYTYARSSEYPGMKFRNHKIIYLSLDVNDISSEIFNLICTRFGGYIIHNDDLEIGWEKIERQQPDSDDDLSLSEEIVAERQSLFETEEEEERKIYREIKVEPDVEEEAEEREWAPPVVEVKEPKPDKKQNYPRNGRNHRGEGKKEQNEVREQKETREPREQREAKEQAKPNQKEHQREHQKEQQKSAPKNNGKPTGKEIVKEAPKEAEKQHHRRGHRGGRKHSSKPHNKEGAPMKPQNPKTDA